MRLSISRALSCERRRRVATVLALAGLLAAGACDIATAPLPGGATRYEPPPVYARWWGLVEECSGRRGDFAAWSWYRVPVNAWRDAGYGAYEAYTDVAAHRIVMKEGLETNGSPIRHEMLHALLGPMFASETDVLAHPPAYFRGLCAGVVWCDKGCEDAGPAPPSPPDGAPALPLLDFEVGIQVIPTSVSHTGTDRALTLVLHARNVSGKAGWLMLEPTPGISPPAAYWWGFRVVATGQPLPITDLALVDSAGIVSLIPEGRVPFASGQTRWLVIDWSGRLYQPGNYQVVGIFNTRQIAAPLTITP